MAVSSTAGSRRPFFPEFCTGEIKDQAESAQPVNDCRGQQQIEAERDQQRRTEKGFMEKFGPSHRFCDKKGGKVTAKKPEMLP